MKILVIGDQHFQLSNVIEVEEFLNKLTVFLSSHKNEFTFIVSAGDLLHTHERVYTQPLNKALEYIKLLCSYSKTYVLVGNHDYINNSQYLSNNHWLNALKEWKLDNEIVVVDKVMVEQHSNYLFTFAPYLPNGRFIEALNEYNKDDNNTFKESKIIFCHQSFNNCKMGAIIEKNSEDWPLNYPLICSGHIHDKQQPQNNLYYVGTPFQQAFGESHDKTIAIFDIFNDKINRTEIDLEICKKYCDYITLNQIDSYLPRVRGKTRLSITCSFEEFKAFKKSNKYKELTDRGIKILPHNLIRINYEKSEKKDELENKSLSIKEIIYTLLEKEDSKVKKLYLELNGDNYKGKKVVDKLIKKETSSVEITFDELYSDDTDSKCYISFDD